MKKYIFDFSADLWVGGVEIEANSPEEAKEKFFDLTVAEMIENGSIKDGTISNIDYDEEEDPWWEDEDEDEFDLEFDDEEELQIVKSEPTKDASISDSESEDSKEIQERTKEAWLWNSIIKALNNEEAYYEGWIWLWPDDETYDQCKEDFGEDKESFEELHNTFLKVYKTYREDGICNATPEQLAYCHKLDELNGWDPIENLILK